VVVRDFRELKVWEKSQRLTLAMIRFARGSSMARFNAPPGSLWPYYLRERDHEALLAGRDGEIAERERSFCDHRTCGVPRSPMLEE
jgi:hypothetical protein